MAVKSDTSKQWRFSLPIADDSRLISRRKKSPQAGDEGISVSFRQQLGRPFSATEEEVRSPMTSKAFPGKKASGTTFFERGEKFPQSSGLRGRLEVLKEVSREARIIGPFTPRPGGEKLYTLQVFGKKESGN
jgi:hypothetical protein